MKSFQGKIVINERRIESIDENPGSLIIINENTQSEFINAWAYPGFSDCHGHVAALGSKLNELDLSKCRSAE